MVVVFKFFLGTSLSLIWVYSDITVAFAIRAYFYAIHAKHYSYLVGHGDDNGWFQPMVCKRNGIWSIGSPL